MEYKDSGRGRRATTLLSRLVVSLGIILAVGPAQAQGPARTAAEVYPESSHKADDLLRSAAAHAQGGEWAEAVKIYERVIEQFGDKVVALPKDDPGADPSGESKLFVDVRQFCQRRLAALPAEARAIYRERVDPQAERWYRHGVADRDRTLLRRVVEEAFCSSWGDDALELLGDLAFEDGQFAEALAAYRQLVPDQPNDRLTLTHPDPSVDVARVAAKKLLCRAVQAENPPTTADLDEFAQRFPNATGALAGRKGSLVQIVREAIAHDQLAVPTQCDERWPTFAGAPTRTRIAPGPIDVGSFQWKVPLEPPVAMQLSRLPSNRFRPGPRFMEATPNPSERVLAYHPIVLGDQVIICDDKQIVAYDLNERPVADAGSQTPIPVAWKHEHGGSSTPVATRGGYVGVPYYTLTAFGDRIYARLGPPGGSVRANMVDSLSSVIVAVDQSTDGKLLWKRASKDITLPLRNADGRFAGFEGTPVADARGVYVALTEGGAQTASYVACLDPDKGNVRWIRFLFQAAAPENGMGGLGFGPDLSHRLLSLDGPTLYYQTNLGAVAALDAETGRIKWLATYPRQEHNGASHARDLNPAVIHDGLVIVAPKDSTRIFAFDAATGRLVWRTTEPSIAEVVHLLGVAKGRLVATGDYVWLIDVKTGKILRRSPDKMGGYEGFGRGILAGERIYWPTKNEIHVLDQVTGLPVEDSPIRLQERFGTGGGNLAVGDGYLIIAQPDALVVFCQNSRLIERYRDEIARAPDQASNYFRLAQAAEATGREPEALQAFRDAIARARPSENIDGHPLTDEARDHLFRLLMKLGSRSASGRDWAEAAQRFDAASAAARVDRDRLTAKLRLADTQAAGGDPGAAVATFQALLLDERSRSLSVAESGHRTVRADLLITDRLTNLLQEHGRELYATFDRQARELLDRGKAEKSAVMVEEVVRNFPAAAVVPAALWTLGQLDEAQQRPADAARAYRKLLTAATTDADRARALWGLARAYEAQKLWRPARDTYAQLLARFGELKLEETNGERLGSIAAERLAQEPMNRIVADGAEPDIGLPLARRFSRRWSRSARPMVAEGVAPSAEASRVFLASGTTIRPIDPNTGQAPWTADLGGEPVWIGYLADRLIAATETSLTALSLEKGSPEWHYDLSNAKPARRGPNPFAKPTKPGPQAAPARLDKFRIVGSRVFCLRGDSELLAFDGDSGLIDWSYAPTVGRLNPHLWIGSERIVLQVGNPNAIVVLETADGRTHAEFPQNDDEPWGRDPLPIDDDHVALVVNRQTVALFDLVRGITSWTTQIKPVQPSHGAPRLLGDAERLLVLNDGNELIRLDPRTGGRLWSSPLGSEDLSERPAAMAFDADRFYYCNGQSLAALAMGDGSLLWRRFLTGAESGWSVTLTRGCVAVYPRPQGSSEPELDRLPLLFCRRDNGELVQRLLLQAPVSEVAVRLSSQGALVATQSGVWTLGHRAGKAP
jgi:outer membrane protein assembly factor BamB/tetratricopeptide (TPR) repeat protein